MFYKKFRSFLPSIEDLHGPEVDIIRRNQLEFDPVPVSLQGQPVALGVEMAVIAAAHAIALQQLQNLRAFVAAVPRRIVEKAHLFMLSCRLKAGLQPP